MLRETPVVPIILHHGFFGRREWRIGPIRQSYFHRIDRAIAGRGHPIIAADVHPTSSVEKRARQLKQQIVEQIDAMSNAERGILIAHSMGGLDARYALSQLGLSRYVKTLVTIATPHRGSPYADWMVRNVGDRFGLLKAAAAIGIDLSAAHDLTTAACVTFNETVTDHPEVTYFSISCVRPLKQMPAFAFHSHSVVSAAEGENDGLVSLSSSQWGTHLGIWPIDHWQAINRPFTIRHRAPDASPRYLELLDRVI